MDFSTRFPTLFHVTWAAAVGAMKVEGVMSAQRLCERHGHGDPATLTANRRRPVAIGPHLLRRQGMSDRALRPRLDPSITVEAWRFAINGMVFLFPDLRSARRLVASEARAQVILRFSTAHLMRAVEIGVCRYNNGYVDRRPLSVARRRSFSDYQPVADWAGTPVAEVVATGAIPPSVPFTVLPLP